MSFATKKGIFGAGCNSRPTVMPVWDESVSRSAVECGENPLPTVQSGWEKMHIERTGSEPVFGYGFLMCPWRSFFKGIFAGFL